METSSAVRATAAPVAPDTQAAASGRLHSMADVQIAVGFWMRVVPTTRPGGPHGARVLSKPASTMAGILGTMWHHKLDHVNDRHLSDKERTTLYAGLAFEHMHARARIPRLPYDPAVGLAS